MKFWGTGILVNVICFKPGYLLLLSRQGALGSWLLHSRFINEAYALNQSSMVAQLEEGGFLSFLLPP